MSEAAARALAHAIARVAVNRVSRDGDRWVKRRLAGSTMLIAPGNLYLQRAGHFTMIASAEAWARREVEVHHALYGASHAGFGRNHAIWVAHVPGDSLTELVERESPHVQPAIRAAGIELRRAHSTTTRNSLFSHGDLHLSNIVYSATDRRARLLDFETQHTPHVGVHARHADDLVCLALDCAGKAPSQARAEQHWQDLLAGYLEAGSALAVTHEVAANLAVAERLLPRSLQLIRTRNMPKSQLGGVLAAMRRIALA
jgi:tRNA A-37 threonylcarbamoyl transferase component Bud32